MLRSSRKPSALVGIALLVPLAAGCGGGNARVMEPGAEPGENMPGGETTNTLLLGSNAFTRPAENITEEHDRAFFTGNSFFNQSWVQAPASTDSRDGLGPLFNARSCAACHFKDGRGRPPLDDDEEFLGILLRLSIPGEGEHGAALPDPTYGGQLQPFAITGVEPEGRPRVLYDERTGHYDDGERYELLLPRYEIEGWAYGEPDERLRISPRVAPAVIGLGLLEAVPAERLEQLADPDDQDSDGISGRINWVPDVESGELRVGRFGWKAEQPSVLQQAAGAFLGDMGITTRLFPEQNCSEAEGECAAATDGGQPEIADDLLDKVATYSRLLGVPVRHDSQNAEVLRGKKLFVDVGCASCHVARHETSHDAELVETRGQVIFPYTDLLLHDMGEDLSDERPSFVAEGREWRTPPLWGIGRYVDVNGHDRLLHDGRARGVAEAILWHGGEGEAARDAFRALEREERAALIRFVESL